MAFENKDFPPANNYLLATEWQALVALSPENGQPLTNSQSKELAANISSSITISDLEIKPDEITDNVLFTFCLSGVPGKDKAILHCVETMFDGIQKTKLDLGFVAMQLAESIEVDIDGPDILTNSDHDVSTEADDLFKQLTALNDTLSNY